MEIDRINEILYDLKDKTDDAEYRRAVDQLIDATSYGTQHIIKMKKKDLSKYTKGTKEYDEAVAYNKGMWAVISTIKDCFPEEES